MSVYEIRYQSNGIWVKGYLGLPPLGGIDELSLRTTLRKFTHGEVLHAVVSDVFESGACNPPDTGGAMATEAAGTVMPGKLAADMASADGADTHVATATGMTQIPTPERVSTAPLNTPNYPALLYCRGGIGRVGLSRLEWIVDYCRLGYVVVAPWYRGTLGTEGRDEFGGIDCEDSDEALRLLQSLPFVNPDDVTVMGFSRGAVNAARTTIRVGGVRRLILWGGIASLADIYEERIELRRMLKRVLGGTPRKVPEAYASRSPVAMAHLFPCPVRIVHSTNDVQVPFHHAQDMVRALLAARSTVDWHFYEGYGHHFDPLVRHAVMDRMLSEGQAQGTDPAAQVTDGMLA